MLGMIEVVWVIGYMLSLWVSFLCFLDGLWLDYKSLGSRYAANWEVFWAVYWM